MRSISNAPRNVGGTMSKSQNVNVDWQIEDNIRYFSQENDDVIIARIEQLDNEWDLDRRLALNASVISISGIILCAVFGKKWLMIPAVISAMFTQHALRGWSQAPGFLGNRKVRTKDQIDQEKYALIEILKNR